MKEKLIINLFIFFSTLGLAYSNETTYAISDLKQDQATTERLLAEMVQLGRGDLVERLLPIYQGFEQTNPDLVAFAQVRIAQQQFYHHHNREAKRSLQAVRSQYRFAKADLAVIDQYLQTLEERDRWQFDINAHYTQTQNVNRTASVRQIENTGFIKNDEMLPQSAKGIAYYATANRNWQLQDSHFLHFSNDLSGKYYWNKRDYDEISNRTTLGYLYQNAFQRWGIKPFYERQWLGSRRYNWAKGIRVEWQKPFAKQWQISTSLEWSGQRYFTQAEKNSSIKLASATLIWQPNEAFYLYWGTDVIREQTLEKQYSNDTKILRTGIYRTLPWKINADLSASFARRRYKDELKLGGILPLGKIRRDKIYSISFNLWKSDWHWRGFTPKVQFKWKKQDSNVKSMFSYAEKSLNIAVEKRF